MGFVRRNVYCSTMLCLLALLWAFIAVQFSQRRAQPTPGLLSVIDPALAFDEERRAGLDRPVASLALNGTGLGDALDQLSRQTHSTIIVRWSRLNELNLTLTPKSPITLSLHDVTLATALRTILRQASPELTYGIAPGAKIVVTRGWPDTPKALTIHDLRGIGPAPTLYMSSVGLQPIPESQQELGGLLTYFLDKANSPRPQVAVWGGKLIAIETPENQRCLRMILEKIIDTDPNPGGGEKTPSPRSQLEQLLEQHIAEVRFDGVSLEKAIDDLRERSKANIVVDWTALKAVGLERSTLVRIHLWDAPLRLALWTLFTDDRGDHPAVDFDIEENVLTITNGGSTGYVKVYDVRDLVDAAIARRRAVEATIAQPPVSAPASGYLFANLPSPEQIEEEESAKVANVIRETVGRKLLYDRLNGTNRAWCGRLLIRASPMRHGQIENCLKRMRESVRRAATQPSAGDIPDAKK
ncbi:MAG: hypothetical protein JWN24_3221 [Phycisphaerales bacterium]|nr:hypothetical protein [Phycisphaerales bacterium]